VQAALERETLIIASEETIFAALMIYGTGPKCASQQTLVEAGV
jgi:hypothetical protein